MNNYKTRKLLKTLLETIVSVRLHYEYRPKIYMQQLTRDALSAGEFYRSMGHNSEVHFIKFNI
jgi:hypothetical protein